MTRWSATSGPAGPMSPSRSLHRGAASRRRSSPHRARTPRAGTLLKGLLTKATGPRKISGLASGPPTTRRSDDAFTTHTLGRCARRARDTRPRGELRGHGGTTRDDLPRDDPQPDDRAAVLAAGRCDAPQGDPDVQGRLS